MALIVQNDLGTVANANGYITNAFFKSYFADRGVDNEWSDAEIDAAIVVASDWADNRATYAGRVLEVTQTTVLPRYGAWYTGIPLNFKKAIAELALRQLRKRDAEQSLSDDPVIDNVASKREKVGPIEEETVYRQVVVSPLGDYPAVMQLLQPFFGVQTLTVTRA